MIKKRIWPSYVLPNILSLAKKLFISLYILYNFYCYNLLQVIWSYHITLRVYTHISYYVYGKFFFYFFHGKKYKQCNANTFLHSPYYPNNSFNNFLKRSDSLLSIISTAHNWTGRKNRTFFVLSHEAHPRCVSWDR